MAEIVGVIAEDVAYDVAFDVLASTSVGLAAKLAPAGIWLRMQFLKDGMTVDHPGGISNYVRLIMGNSEDICRYRKSALEAGLEVVEFTGTRMDIKNKEQHYKKNQTDIPVTKCFSLVVAGESNAFIELFY